MSNTLTIDQVSSVLRKVLSQATGRTDLAALDTNQLLTIGQVQLTSAPDPILNAISQMITKTIFSARPYKAKFAQLRMESASWGNVVRKIKILDKETDLDENSAYKLHEGSAIDQYQVDLTNAIQLNYIGQQTYTLEKTIFKDQFNVCFNSAGEFAQFISMILTYVANKIEKIHEETARQTVVGAAAGLLADKAANPGRVIHLLTEYNAITGLKLDGTTLYLPDNFDAFVKWLYSRIEDLSSMMTEYSDLYQTKLTKGSLMQHTPVSQQAAFFYAPFFRQASNRVLADTYHNELLKLIPNSEMVNYWQAIKKPDQINVTNPNYLGNDGAIKQAVGPITQSNVFGIIADKDAMGYSPIITDAAVSPYNAKGKYWNYFWHFNERHYVDFTEKIILLVID